MAVLATAVEMSRPLIEAAQHQLVQHFPDEPVQVMGDAARLAQVFANLLNNAAKYTRRGGRIELRLQALPSEAVVRVRDNGAGIAPDMLRRVFHLFTQLPQPEERRQGGLGIGLSLVEGLVRLHGGRVEAHSAGLGQGSEFVVRLPRLGAGTAPPPEEPGPAIPATSADVADKGAAAISSLAAIPVLPEEPRAPEVPAVAVVPGGAGTVSAASPPAGTAPSSAPVSPPDGTSTSPLRPRRILVVDDNVDAANTVADLLSMTGSEVEVAHDGTCAVEHTARFRPDVVLLDIGLPDISGYDAARRIRQLEGVRQPVLIALTGWGQQQDKQMAAEAGFDQHWTKPVEPQRLLDLARPS